MFILFSLLIIHVLFTFYIRYDRNAEDQFDEEIKIKYLYKSKLVQYTFIYTISTFLILVFYLPNHWVNIFVILGAGLAHGLIDYLKIKLHKQSNEFLFPYLFLIAQMFQIILIVLVGTYITLNFTPTNLDIFILNQNLFLVGSKYILAFLLIGKAGNIFFKELMGKYKPTTEDIKEAKENNFHVFSSHQKAGSVIGILERILLMASMIVGSYTTIGLIIAAKSVARFKSLEVTKFGEYFIIGTMFSILYALFTYYLLFKLY
ncbi:MAG: DUF3307 domain-containing protein [Firmicutes bacterium]|nr:DUF3307 domain-containing protein [Bacillota bacterium]